MQFKMKMKFNFKSETNNILQNQTIKTKIKKFLKNPMILKLHQTLILIYKLIKENSNKIKMKQINSTKANNNKILKSMKTFKVV